MKKVLWIALVLFFGPAAFAQDAPPAMEVAVDYSYIRVPQYSFVPNASSNGGGGSFAYFFNKHIGVHADFQDYAGYTLNFSVPARTQGCNSGSDCALSARGSLFTYTIGPVLRFRVKHFEPFAEFLFGGAHNNLYANIYKDCYNQGACVNLSRQPNNSAFDYILGGGVDFPLTRHIAARLAQVDYTPTHFGNSLTLTNSTQSNLRFQAGVVVRF